jgi:hypothetical protein
MKHARNSDAAFFWILAFAGMFMHSRCTLKHEHNVARMERSEIRDSCRSHNTPSWIALRFIQATSSLGINKLTILILWCGPLACTKPCRRGRLHHKN